MSLILSVNICALGAISQPYVSAEDDVAVVDWAFTSSDDVEAVNDAKMLFDTDAAPDGFDGWFNVGMTTGRGATAAQYTAPTGGLEFSNVDDMSIVSMKNSGSGIAHALFDDAAAATGIYEIDFKVKPNGTEFAADVTGAVKYLKEQYSDKQRNPFINIGADGTVFIPSAANPIFNMADAWVAGTCRADDWVDVKAFFNLTDGLVKTVVMQEGKIIAINVQNVKIGAEVKANGLGFLRLISKSNNGNSCDVTNVKVTKLEREPAYSGFRDDFSYSLSSKFNEDIYFGGSGSTQNALKGTGWSITGQRESFHLSKDDDGLTYMLFDSPSQYFYALSPVKSAWENALKDLVHVEARIKAESSDEAKYVRMLVLGANKPATLELYPKDGTINVNGPLDEGYSGKNSIKLDGTFNSDEWLDVDMYVNASTGHWQVFVSQNDTVIATGKDLFVRPALANNGMDTIRFDSNGALLKVDYVAVDNADILPDNANVNEDEISIIGTDGNIAKPGGKVSPSIEKIEVKFDCSMAAPVNGNEITLTGGGETVSCTVKAKDGDSSTWEIIPDKILSDNTEYTVFMPSGIKGAEGRTLGKDCEITFTTETANELYKIDGLTFSDGVKVIGTEDFDGREITVNTTAFNPTDNVRNLVWNIVFYDDNGICLAAFSKDAKLSAGRLLRADENPVFTANKPAGTAKVLVTLWDSGSLKPLCKPLEIKKYEAYASFGERDSFSSMTVTPNLTSAVYEGVWSREISANNLYVICNVDNAVMYDLDGKTSVDVEVDYYDGNDGYFAIQYDGANPDTTLYSSNTAMEQTETVRMSGSHEWKTHTFRIKDMKMTNRISNSDFRVAGFVYKEPINKGTTPENVYISSVRVKYTEKKEEESTNPPVAVVETEAESKTAAAVSYYDGMIYLSGETGSDYVTTELVKADSVIDVRQFEAENGSYNITIPYGIDDAEAGEYMLRIGFSAEDYQEIPIYLNTRSGLSRAYDEINNAANTDEKNFLTCLNSNIGLLNFYSSGADSISEADVTTYMNYVKAHPLKLDSASDEVNNVNIFNQHKALIALNAGLLKNISQVITESNIGGDTFVKLYKSIADNVTEQEYMTKLLSGKSIKDISALEEEAEKALVLTAAKYAGGSDEIKSLVKEYATLIGIAYSDNDAVYRSLMGRTFNTIEEFADAYKKACSPPVKPGSNGGGSKTGGGSSGGMISGGKEAKVNIGSNMNGTGADNSQIKRIFIDLDSVVWASEAILALADKNIVSGVDGERFMPDNNITREAFTKILIGAMNISDYSYTANHFRDVDASDWFAAVVNVAFDKGIISGVGQNEFGVGRNISRQDMAVMIYNALKMKGAAMNTSRPGFVDFEEISDYAKDAVSALYNLGAVNGTTETTFEPMGTATRAQAAKIIYGVLDKLN